MNYRSFNDLYRTIVDNSYKFPADIDLVVGIPRSGLLAANILALHLNKPLTDVERFLEERPLSFGLRLRKKSEVKPIKKVLIMDDSVASGRAMSEVKQIIHENGLDTKYHITYACVYCLPEATDKIDIYLDQCANPRVFEWNIMHHEVLEKSCVDIDGVLCRDPTEQENDDGHEYGSFLQNVPAYVIPSVTIGHLVTNRLEKYRKETEDWLKKNDIKYKQLWMSPYKSKSERQQANRYGRFKADIYMKTKSLLFIESSLKQAREIANVSGRKVYCIDEKRMIEPSMEVQMKNSAVDRIKLILHRLKLSFIIRLARSMKRVLQAG